MLPTLCNFYLIPSLLTINKSISLKEKEKIQDHFYLNRLLAENARNELLTNKDSQFFHWEDENNNLDDKF